jgi:ribosomal protein L29
MAKNLTMEELRRMNLSDLEKEIEAQRRTITHLRLNISLGKEKAVHLLRKARKQLARMLTLLTSLSGLHGSDSASTMQPHRSTPTPRSARSKN